ncbi:MAG: hypothetical protein R3D30_10770 [Hyphomicrobiales bacterium]
MRDPKNQMFAEACALLKQAEQLHRQFFEPSPGARGPRWEPPVDIFETEAELVIITALPGVAPEAVRAEVEGQTLIITGVRRCRRSAASCGWRFLMAASSGASRCRAA